MSPTAGGQQALRGLITAAVSAPPAERVERFRDRLADCGGAIVEPLLHLEREQPRLGLFVVTVLEASAKRGVAVAERGIRLLITDAATAEARASAADAIGRVRTAARPNAVKKRSYDGVVDVINDARTRREEPVLDAAELREGQEESCKSRG